MNVEGNEKGDETAKKAVEMTGTRRYLEQFNSITNVGFTVMERK